MEMDSPEMNGVQNNAIDGTGRVSGVPSYADWWTRADAVAAARVAAEKDYDEDEYELAQAMRSLSPADAASPWWEVIELAATFGAAGGGIAAVLMQEAAVATLVAALPLVAAGARRRKDNVRSRVAAERLMELREETRAMARKAQRDATLESTATRAANAVVPRVSDVVQGAVSGVRNEIRSDLNDVAIKSVALEERMKALEAAVAEQTSSARASAREAGSVAGMLARDVAAARVDAREGIQSLAVELRKATAVADDAKGEVMKELNTLWQLMESIESEADGVKLTTDGSGTTLAALMEEVRAAGAAAMAAKIAAEESLNASDRAPSAERLESVRDAVKEALDEAKEVSVSGAPLDETKLAAALENVVSKLKTAAGIERVDLTPSRQPRRRHRRDGDGQARRGAVVAPGRAAHAAGGGEQGCRGGGCAVRGQSRGADTSGPSRGLGRRQRDARDDRDAGGDGERGGGACGDVRGWRERGCRRRLGADRGGELLI